jgi:hypothetical protein
LDLAGKLKLAARQELSRRKALVADEIDLIKNYYFQKRQYRKVIENSFLLFSP